MISSKKLIKKVPFNFSLDFLLDEQEAKTLHSREKRSNQKGMKEVFREGPEAIRTLVALQVGHG